VHSGQGTSNPSPSPSPVSSTVVATVGVGLVVFALLIGHWLTTPFDDWVTLDAPAVLPEGVVEDDLPASARFECSQPLGTATEPVASSQAREAMTVQTLSRTPCDSPRVQFRVLGLVNLMVIALLLVGTLVIWMRRGRPAAMGSVGAA
jgi:hypothetical protein